MSLPTMIYLIDVICGDWAGLEFVCGLFIIGVMGVKFVVILVPLVHDLDTKEEEKIKELDKKLSKLYVIAYITIVGMLLSNLIPERDTAYKMLAAYGVESVVANPDVQKLGGKSLQVLEKAMDDYLKETNGGE